MLAETTILCCLYHITFPEIQYWS